MCSSDLKQRTVGRCALVRGQNDRVVGLGRGREHQPNTNRGENQQLPHAEVSDESVEDEKSEWIESLDGTPTPQCGRNYGVVSSVVAGASVSSLLGASVVITGSDVSDMVSSGASLVGVSSADSTS